MPFRVAGLGGTVGGNAGCAKLGLANLTKVGAVPLGRNGSLVRSTPGVDWSGKGPSKVSGWGGALRSNTSLAAGLPDVGGSEVGKCIIVLNLPNPETSRSYILKVNRWGQILWK